LCGEALLSETVVREFGESAVRVCRRDLQLRTLLGGLSVEASESFDLLSWTDAYQALRLRRGLTSIFPLEISGMSVKPSPTAMNGVLCEPEDRLVSNITINLCAQGLADRDIIGRSDAFAILYVDSRVPTTTANDVQSMMSSPARQPETPGGLRDVRWDRVGMTETLNDNLNPRWAKSFTIPYFFERAQRIAVDVYDRDVPEDEPLSQHDFLGTAECSVPSLVRSRGKRLELSLKDIGRPQFDCGTITLIVEEEGSIKRYVELQAELLDLKQGVLLRGYSPKLTISRPSAGSRTEESRSSIPYGPSSAPSSSETAPAGRAVEDWIIVVGPVDSRRASKASYAFNKLGVNSHRLCFGDESVTLRMDILGRKDVPIASAVGSLAEWRTKTVLPLLPPDVSPSAVRHLRSALSPFCGRNVGKELGQLKLCALSEHTEHSFLDYVGAGYEISLAIAIDFTASNGDPQRRGSLHFLDQHIPNEYELAIQAVGSILAQYASDQVFPAYGFGAKLPPLFRGPSHSFTLTGNDDPSCVEIGGVLDAYRQTLYNVRFSGPTVFAEIVRAASGLAQVDLAQGAQAYTIMLILTDGVINDMQDTIDEIVRASSLPLSIVIIGVGESDFSDMDQLDGDDRILKSSSGHRAERDIVQFVPFRKYLGAPEVLVAKVLEEIPGQFLTYMNKHGIEPPVRI
jgi:Copine/C2 domain